MFWSHMKFNKMYSLMWRNGLPWQQKVPSKNSLYFVFKCIYLKNELGDPHFSLLESDQHARIKLSAKLKNTLWGRFMATITIEKC